MRAILEKNHNAKNTISQTRGIFGEKIGVFGKVFGCWHKDLSRPLTSGNISYRVCSDCGARRPFDEKSFKTYGAFYYPPAISPAVSKR